MKLEPAAPRAPGRRERKKQQTHRLIVETAARLFARRGFDAVTVAEIAEAVDISTVTLFNYFPTKEDLFFAGMEFFEDTLLEAVKQRPAGEPALRAFERRVLEGSRRLADETNADAITKAAKLIRNSPALAAREREIVTRYTERLAAVLAAEAGAPVDDVEAWTAASALMGAHRSLVAHVRNQAARGVRGARLATGMRAQAGRAFRLLERGLGERKQGLARSAAHH